MYKNYLLTTLRTILKYRTFSLINVTGLAIGIACCILIVLYVADEISYDKYHKNAGQIYRAGINGRMGDREFMTHTTAAPFAAACVADIPEVVTAARFTPGSNKLITYKDKNFIEDGVYYTDSTVFKIFSWELLKGNPETALAGPGSIVFTESMATKYFGNEDPMDKTVQFDNGREFKVTGIMQDVPHNSHFHFDFLASLSTFNWSRNQEWLSDSYSTYFLIAEGNTDKDVEAKFGELINKYVGPQVEAGLGVSLEEWESSGNRYGFFLEPITGIYLNSEATMHMEPVGSKRYVIIFSIVAIFILIIACVNFMNLTTAKSVNRAKEVGVRKVAGAHRKQLIFQFLSESIILSIIAMIIALVIVHLLLPNFNNLIEKELTVSYLASPWFIPGLIFIMLFTGLFAGSYSSISMSSFKIITVLKGKLQSGNKRAWFRSGLVIFQFAMSVGIIIATFIVFSQLRFIQNKKLGFEKENRIVIERPSAMGEQRDAFKQELLKLPSVLSASACSTIPGRDFNGTVFRREGSSPDEMIHFRRINGDYDYLNTIGIKLKEGRYFSEDFPGDTMAVVLNESAVKALGYEEAVGKMLIGYGDDNSEIYLPIIGVLEDFHTSSMKDRISNVVMQHPDYFYASYMVLKVNGTEINKTLESVEDLWKEFLPQQPFDYFFFDDMYDELHKDETRTAKILGIFSVLALFISSLGLFGLSSFISEQRTKEIGVRKVMGSTVSGILLLLSKQFSKWVIFGNILAWPLAYYFMNKWLQNFEYRINIALWIFIVAAVGSLILALLTVSYQSIKAASKNPANSLRYE